MASVTPPEGYNSYYMKHFVELEDDLKKDAARAEQRSKERAAELERDYHESIHKHEEKLSKAVDDMRDSSQEAALKARESDRSEIERIRRLNYDKNGRNATNELETARERLKETVANAEAQQRNDANRLKQAEAGFAKKSEDQNAAHNERLDRAVRRERESANSAFEQAYSEDRGTSAIQRQEAARRYEDLNQTRMEEQADQRRAVERVMADAQRDLDNKQSHQDEAIESRLHKVDMANRRRMEDSAVKLKKSAEDQTRHLRDQIDDLVAAERTYMKDKAQARHDAIREHDSEWRARERILQESHEADAGKYKEMLQRSDDYNGHLNERNLHERDNYFTKLMARTAAENHEKQKDLSTQYDSTYKQLENGMKKEKARSQELLESSLHDAHEQREDALRNQARTYQETIASQRAMDNDKIQGLERELKRKTDAQDTSEISPAVENAVRRSVAREYEKTFAAESDRNKRVTSELQRSYTDRFQNAEAEHATVLTRQEQNTQAERHQAEARFMEAITDTEYQKEQSLRSKEHEHEKQTELMNRSFTQMNTRQRNEFENMLNTLREDSASKIAAIRQDADFQAKMAQRGFSARQNDLVREYEKKMSDQKVTLEEQLSELKAQNQQLQRDGDRKQKAALEEQGRMYEQRLAQAEQQHKERERTLSQNYEDEMEKVKRANAMLASKRG